MVKDFNGHHANGSVFVIDDLEAFLSGLEPVYDDSVALDSGDHVVTFTAPQGAQYFMKFEPDLDGDGGAYIQLETDFRVMTGQDDVSGLRHVYDLPDDVVKAYKSSGPDFEGLYVEPFEFD